MSSDASITRTVLIVDDEPVNVRVLSGALKDDFHIKVAINGKMALEIACSGDPPDIILLDVLMPGLDGYQTCEKLKLSSQSMDIPVIFITTKDQIEDENKGFMLGAVDYISKPFHLPIVLARLKTHLALKVKSDAIKRESLTDGLTHLANRRAFDERLEQEWSRANREGKPLSIILGDIDYFKLFNDLYGHVKGDECLKIVAQTLNSCTRRPGDLVARYGGEEFVYILPATTQEGAAAMAKSIVQAVYDLDIRHESSKTANNVTLSLGVATHNNKEDFKTSQALVQAADSALYKAKEHGRNGFEIYN